MATSSDMTIFGDNDTVSFDGEPSRETLRLSAAGEKDTSSDFVQPASLRELSDEEVAREARAFWLDDLCERRDQEHDERDDLLWET